MDVSVFLENIKKVLDYKTLYVMGGLGQPLTETGKSKILAENHSYNNHVAVKNSIQTATADTFAFDCVGLIKAVLWGWCGDTSKYLGGAKYQSNNVPDIGADKMYSVSEATDKKDFSNIVPGECVWMTGHIGIYLGDGKVIECSPAFKNKVQITACKNIKGYPNNISGRTWTGHGKLPYINYKEETTVATNEPSAYAKEAWDKVTKAGIINRDNPQSVVTAEQLAVILDRLGLISNG